jgi:amidase
MALTAVEQADLVRSGEFTARHLVEACLVAIERENPKLNAFVTLCADRALAEADAVRPGDPRPLAGVPIAIKDLIVLTEGVRTTHGSRAMGDWVPDRDSPVVALLRAAGAIVVGKTNTPEFGLRPVTEPVRFGPTRNPWNPELTAGGSSGGSAAAVAGGMVALAHGSDAAGSVRIPASCCGLVGLKPSNRRVPVGPDYSDFADFACDGPLARTVLDAAVMLDVIGGGEPEDPRFGPLKPGTPFAEAARRPPGRLHVRVCDRPPLEIPVDQECRDAVRTGAALLEQLGHEVEEGVPDWDDWEFSHHWATWGAVSWRAMFDRFGELRGRPLDLEELEPATRELILGQPSDTRPFAEAAEGLQRFAHHVLHTWPPGSILLTPTMARTPAPVGGLPPEEGVRCSAFTRVFNVTGQPAISLPLHRTADGIPVGVQLAGPPGSEARLISLAAELEQARGPVPAG